MSDLKNIKNQIVGIQRQIKPLENQISGLENEIDCLVDEARSKAKYKINDLVKLKRSGQNGFVKDIIASYNPSVFDKEADEMIISYLIGAVDKNNKQLKLKTISNAYFPECLIQKF